MPVESPILVTGAAGRVGGVGRVVVERLRDRGLPVRALVHREDDRAQALRAIGAEVVVGDLTIAADVARTLAGCRRLYFGMSVSASYLEATVIAAAVGRERGDLEVFVNISQMTVSQMSLTRMTDSPQQRQHFLAEQVLNWSGLPVVHVRPTAFLENPLFMNLAASRSQEKERSACLSARDGRPRLPSGCRRGHRDYSGAPCLSYRQSVRADRAEIAGYEQRGGGIFGGARPKNHIRGRASGAMARSGTAQTQPARACLRAYTHDGASSRRQPL